MPPEQHYVLTSSRGHRLPPQKKEELYYTGLSSIALRGTSKNSSDTHSAGLTERAR
jgi:hypothetical protein